MPLDPVQILTKAGAFTGIKDLMHQKHRKIFQPAVAKVWHRDIICVGLEKSIDYRILCFFTSLPQLSTLLTNVKRHFQSK